MWRKVSVLMAVLQLILLPAAANGYVLTSRAVAGMAPANTSAAVAASKALDKAASVGGFQCERPGTFPVTGSLRDFYKCDALPGLGMTVRLCSCPSGSTFSDVLNACIQHSYVHASPRCISSIMEEDAKETDNINLMTDFEVERPQALQRQKRFVGIALSVGSFLLGAASHFSQVRVHERIESRLTGIEGGLKSIESSVLSSRLENEMNAKITQSLIKKGMAENKLNFQVTQNLVEQSMLENRISAAATQGLIIKGYIANEMNFVRVQGSISDVKNFMDLKMNESRSYMERGFKSITDAIDRARTEPLVSKVLTAIKEYNRRLNHILSLPEDHQRDEMTRDSGYIKYLETNTLENTLRDIIHQKFAIPKDDSDVSALPILDLLVDGLIIHANMLISIISSYFYLAGKEIKDRDLDHFNIYLKRAFSSISHMKLNLGFETSSGLSVEVQKILDEVRRLPYINQMQGSLKTIEEKQLDLDELKHQIQGFTAKALYLQAPIKIQSKLDFTASSVPLPVGWWEARAQVSYAVQLVSDRAISPVGEWSSPYTILDESNPIVHLPSAGVGETRFVYRKFGRGTTPELVAIVTDREQGSFRDIGRDLINAASRPNEALALIEVQSLLDDGADVDFTLEHNMTPLHYAAKSGNVRVMQLLLNKTADLHAKSLDGNKALHFAVLHNQEQAIEFLISKGADVNEPTESLGWTPLHIAAVNDNGIAARTLIKHKASINAKDKSDLTPLHLSTLGNGETLEILLNESNLKVNEIAIDGQTSLHYAARTSNPSIAKKLLEHSDTNVNVYSDRFLSPLHYAAMSGNVDTIGSLIQHGASPYIFDQEGSSPLHYAVFFNSKSAVETLISQAQSIESSKDWNAQYPIDLATEGRKTEIMSLMKNASEFINDSFINVFLDDTGISLTDVECSSDVAKEIFVQSERTFIDVGHITSYVDSILSMNSLPVQDGHEKLKQVILNYNRALQNADDKVVSWKHQNIPEEIEKAIQVAKKFEGGFEKRYMAKHINLVKRSDTSAEIKLQELISFLELIKNDASEVKQTVAAVLQKCVDLQDAFVMTLNEIGNSSHLGLIQDENMSRMKNMMFFKGRMNELEEEIRVHKLSIVEIYDRIYEAYKELRLVRMQVLEKINHIPTKRFASSIPTPESDIIAQPLLSLESPVEKEKIVKLKKHINQERVKIHKNQKLIDTKAKLVYWYQTVFTLYGSLEESKDVSDTLVTLDCNMQNIIGRSPLVQSSFKELIALLEMINEAFSSITESFEDFISRGKAAATTTERENELNSIHEGLSQSRCYWKDTGVNMVDLQECFRKYSFIYPDLQLVGIKC